MIDTSQVTEALDQYKALCAKHEKINDRWMAAPLILSVANAVFTSLATITLSSGVTFLPTVLTTAIPILGILTVAPWVLIAIGVGAVALALLSFTIFKAIQYRQTIEKTDNTLDTIKGDGKNQLNEKDSSIFQTFLKASLQMDQAKLLNPSLSKEQIEEFEYLIDYLEMSINFQRVSIDDYQVEEEEKTQASLHVLKSEAALKVTAIAAPILAAFAAVGNAVTTFVFPTIAATSILIGALSVPMLPLIVAGVAFVTFAALGITYAIYSAHLNTVDALEKKAKIYESFTSYKEIFRYLVCALRFDYSLEILRQEIKNVDLQVLAIGLREVLAKHGLNQDVIHRIETLLHHIKNAETSEKAKLFLGLKTLDECEVIDLNLLNFAKECEIEDFEDYFNEKIYNSAPRKEKIKYLENFSTEDCSKEMLVWYAYQMIDLEIKDISLNLDGKERSALYNMIIENTSKEKKEAHLHRCLKILEPEYTLASHEDIFIVCFDLFAQ